MVAYHKTDFYSDDDALVYLVFQIEPAHDKINKMAYVPSDDRSAWASAQSDQSLRYQHEESLDP